MSEVGLTDLSRLLHSKRNESNAIVTSRKRKLRELFAVATQPAGFPQDAFTKPDAPAPTQPESDFLQANEILQGRKLNEQTIPSRQQLSLEVLKKSFAILGYGPTVTTLPSPAPSQQQQQLHQQQQQQQQQPNEDGKRQEFNKPITPPTVPATVETAPVSVPPTLPQQQTKPAPPPTKQSPPLTKSTPALPAQTPVRTPIPVPVSKVPSVTPVPIPVPASALPPKHVAAPTPVSKPTPVPTPVVAPVPPTTAPVAKPVEAAPAAVNDVAKQPQVEAPTPQPRPAQVTFPPGTKDAPSPTKTPVPPPKVEQPKDVAESKPEAETEAAAQPSAAVQTVKTPTDTTRAQDTVSTPGSTSPSATTPAVQDVSTDTSPENEAPSYPEPSVEQPKPEQEEKEPTPTPAPAPAPAPEVKQQPEKTPPPAEIPDSEAASESAEDQLLQESIQSSTAAEAAAAAAPAVAAPAVVTPETKPSESPAPEPAKEDVPAQAEREKTPAPVVEQQPTPKPEAPKSDSEEASSTSESKPEEIPDSEGPTPDKMEVDSTEPTEAAPVEKPAETVKPDVPEDNKPEETLITPITPAAAAPTQKAVPQPAERAVTRVSSGAMRPKSVNEIVGYPPVKQAVQKHAQSEEPQDQLTPLASTPQSSFSRTRRVSSTRKDRKVSAVLFGKQPKRLEEKELVPASKESIQPSDDYFTPLFVQGFAGSSTWMQPMENKLFHANKTIATPDATLCIQDHQACRVLRRVYRLQSTDKWSLRQPKRCEEPVRATSHWDLLLQEVKWMRTDFREERKWKMAVARNLANACAEWCESSPEERKAMQVPAVIPPKVAPAEDELMAEAVDEVADSQATPDLIPGDADSPQVVEELSELFPETIAPSAIFTLQEDDVVFGLRRTPVADQLLDELPMYGAPLKVPRGDQTAPDTDPDSHWRRPAVPISKYVEGDMKLALDGPPRKRSRYHYRNEDSDDDSDDGFVMQDTSTRVNVAPTSDEVALFNPEMKHIRDRLHAGHQFRPPTDHPMPSQSFYESRSASMWTLAEDDELRARVREYSYNWPLISSMLTSKSLFLAGAERRTPWECFERWIQLEGLPSDMQKTQYFKAYNARIEAAQRIIHQQNQIAAQQASAAGAAVPPMRKRPSTPMRVERRRNQKHLTILDAMRKLAKKRETTLQKQQHAASQNAANKKPQDPMAQQPRGPNGGPTKTPRDYSLLRWERDQALAERMAAFTHRQEATRRAALMQSRAQGQAGQRPPTPGVQPGQNGAHPVAAANGPNGVARPNVPAAQALAMAAPNAAPRPRIPMGPPGTPGAAQMAAGMGTPGQMNAANLAQSQMQGMAAQNRMQMPNQQQPDASMMMRAQRISEQQRQAVQMQQAQHQVQPQPLQGGAAAQHTPNQHSSPPTTMVNGVNGVNGMNAMNGVNGVNGVNGAAGVNGVNGVHGVNGVTAPNGISQQAFLSAQAMMAQFNSANAVNGGHTSPPANMQMAAGSPGARPMSQNFQMPPAIANQISQYEAQIRAKNPNVTPERARQFATEQLARLMAARNNAMSAAAGGSAQHGIANSIAATTSPHQYAALLRQQQQQQAAQQAAQQAQAQAQQHQQQHQAQQQQQQHQAQHQHQPQQQQHQAQQLQAQQQLQQQKQQQPQQIPTPQQQAAAVAAAQAQSASSPGQVSQASHNRQSSESATPSAATQS